MTDLDKLDAPEKRPRQAWEFMSDVDRARAIRTRYAEARTIAPTDENALAILRGDLIPYDPDLIIEHELSDD